MGLEKNDNGAEVVRVQKALMAAGYALPLWGADGWLGDETLGVLGRFLADHGRVFDEEAGVVSDADLAVVYGVDAATQRLQLPALPPDRFFDVRAQAGKQHDFGQRPWAKVTAVCLHQTACVLGEKPARWATVGAHLGITRGGKLIHMHDFNRLVVHGNALNAESVGIEMDGMYAGIEGRPETFWKPAWEPNRQPQSPTPELIETAKAAIRWIAGVVESHGGKLQRIVAHRQASRDRQADPGSALWQAVALKMHVELGLDDGGAGFKLGTGFPIPEAWDATRRGVAY